MDSCTSFYINNIKIDLRRSIIIKNGIEVPIEPKVLSVLYVLAKHAGNVVTHGMLMEEVWKGTEVVPNALQRCIAVLRREFDDSARSPKVIATHPKIGYSLLIEVRWESNDKIEPRTNLSLNGRLAQKPFLLIIFLIVALTTVLWFRFYFDTAPPKYSLIKQLTNTDAHETELIFSPDGQYVVFKRYSSACADNIWARHIDSGKEFQLTKNPGGYKNLSFTAGGRELVFASTQKCGINNQSPSNEISSRCWSISSLDFSLSLKSSLEPTYRHQCGAKRIINPRLLPNNKYAYLLPTENNNELVLYDDLAGETNPFYSSKDEYIYHYDYSDKLNAFVVFSKTPNYQNQITVLDLNGNITSKFQPHLPNPADRNTRINGNFTADDEHFLAIVQNTIFKFDLEGSFKIIPSPLPNVVYADLHPNNDMLMVVNGTKDLDIAQVNIDDKPESNYVTDLNQVASPFKSLARSKAQEHLASYQPNGSSIAFVSDRSGNDKVWLWDGSKAVELLHSYSRKTITGLAWSKSGELLAWSEGEEVIVTPLDGTPKTIKANMPISSLFTWIDDDRMLVAVNNPTPGELYILNIKNNELIPMGISNVGAAAILDDLIIYSTYSDKVYSAKLDSPSNQTMLQSINAQSFFIFENNIYSVDRKTLQLNTYSSDGALMDNLIQLTPTTWKVNDFDGRYLLLSQFIGISNEIYEVM